MRGPRFAGGVLERDLVASYVSRLATWWQPTLDLQVRLSSLVVDPLAFTQFDCGSLTDAVLCFDGQSLAFDYLLADGSGELSYVA